MQTVDEARRDTALGMNTTRDAAARRLDLADLAKQMCIRDPKILGA